jgi:uncharacterized membrane protein YphA (DoxX/SURF4 family)
MRLGRIVYALGAVALGLVGLVWGDFATVWQPVQPGVPYRQALAYLTAVALLAGGLGVMWRRGVRAGSVVLGVLYLCFALLWLPRVLGFPRIFGTWGGMLEQLALVPAAALLYTRSTPDVEPGAGRAARAAIVVFGACVLSFGVGHFAALPQTAGMVPRWLPPGQRFWAIVTGVCHLLAGAAILTGVAAGLASRLFTAMLVGFGLLVWAPALAAGPREHVAWAGNAVNLALAGAAWAVADAIASGRRTSAWRQ